MITRSWQARWPAAALIAGVLLAGGAASGYAVTRPPNHDYGSMPAAGAPVVSRPVHATPSSPGQRSGPVSGSQGTRKPPAAGPPGPSVINRPVSVRIPAIGVSAQVVPAGVAAGGQLQIPANPSVVGWWAGGSAPGQRSGAVILSGHIDSAVYGPGALFRLAGIRPGDTVTVRAAGHDYRYIVRALRAYVKANLPAAAIFSQQVSQRLVIISCGGPFDAATGHYLDNIVAYALPER